MNYDEVLNVFFNVTEKETECDINIWIGLDGLFHDSDYPNNNDALICCCGVSYSMNTGDWIVTPWLYTMDSPAIFKTSSSARKMAYFWMNWMGYLYGDGLAEPQFEADWLAIKSNRSLLMMLFYQEGEALTKELLKEEENG